MTARADMIFDTGSNILWRVVLKSPSGLPTTLELRATCEQMALDRVAQYRPECEVVSIARRPTR